MITLDGDLAFGDQKAKWLFLELMNWLLAKTIPIVLVYTAVQAVYYSKRI